MKRIGLAAMIMLGCATMGGSRSVLAQTATATAAGDTLGDETRGKRLFMADGCYQCHGTVGQGGVGLKLAPAPLPAAVIAAYIRNPQGEMPPYGSKVVTDADIRDIHAYLTTIPKPPNVTDIPELNQQH